MLFAYTRYKYRKTAPSAQCQLDDHWGLLLDAGYQLSVEKFGLYHSALDNRIRDNSGKYLRGSPDGWCYVQNAEKLVCDTREEAVNAVLNKKADAAFLYYYTAQALVNREHSGTLTCTLLEETTYNYHIMVSQRASHLLAGILTKAIYAMPNSLIEDISGEFQRSYRRKPAGSLPPVPSFFPALGKRKPSLALLGEREAFPCPVRYPLPAVPTFLWFYHLP